ncbi:MAG: prepilin-type N-terminal cleavage/methylation domain-containing protein [Candidatus Omnitrophota bacterium]|jgi:prepilin-type N-terminal cleavage/methylation domain-containing protein|nr:MAG: prepilin-type N-terminal cleavage/methylation domain-containing protein [Candidatus Omnitrophota bacterium]
MNKKSFTLLELLTVIVIIGVLSTLGINQFRAAREMALQREAVANVRLIAAAERISRMETGAFAACTCTTAANCIAATGCNTLLRLQLNTTNWDYSVTVTATNFVVTAVRGTCTYTYNFSTDAISVSAGCSYHPPS